MINQEIANLLYEMADILEMKNVNWKPQAYRKAAKILEGLSKDVGEIYKKGGIKALKEIPGVGEGIAKKIEQYAKKGRIESFEELKRSIPKGLDKLMDIEGLGPKKAMALYKKLKITDIKKLQDAIKKHKIKNLPGFGEKTEENISKGIEFLDKGKGRMLLGTALELAESIVEELKKLKYVQRISLAGSLRRMNETIGDIDILVTSSNAEAVMDKFTTLSRVSRVLAKGPTKSTVILKDGVQADIRVLKDEDFGAALQYFTGNKEHNIKLRNIAIRKGYKLSEYGLFKRSGKKVAGRTEEEIYHKLGFPYIEPELRENRGELEVKTIPKVVGYNDVKGDFHTHTKSSDGSNTIEEMAKAAMKLGYEYICIMDHSKTRAIAGGLSEERLLKQIEEIKKLNKKYKNFRILAGSEVDILGDGSLDYNDNILKKLDVVGAAVHSAFRQSESATTKRIIKALENKYVDILEHPTGRIINQRAPYQINLQQILEVAKEKNKLLSINCMPDRLDLKDTDINEAINHGVKLCLGTDSHNIHHLNFMKLGIAQARRGWAKKSDIVNCLSLKELPKVFKKISI